MPVEGQPCQTFPWCSHPQPEYPPRKEDGMYMSISGLRHEKEHLC